MHVDGLEFRWFRRVNIGLVLRYLGRFNSMVSSLPDQTIEYGLKQPSQIKISFTLNREELTRSIASDQACFGLKFLLTQMLPDFESKIVSCLPANKQRDSPTLFPLFKQCFQRSV